MSSIISLYWKPPHSWDLLFFCQFVSSHLLVFLFSAFSTTSSTKKSKRFCILLQSKVFLCKSLYCFHFHGEHQHKDFIYLFYFFLDYKSTGSTGTFPHWLLLACSGKAPLSFWFLLLIVPPKLREEKQCLLESSEPVFSRTPMGKPCEWREQCV